MRWLLTLILVVPGIGSGADDAPAHFVGRPVAAVIDEFREAGYPFAYSTNLVTDDLRVQVEPESSEPIEIVRQILRPHKLTLRTEAGVHLVVRLGSADLPKGAILVILTSQGGNQPVVSASVSIDPPLSTVEQMHPGIYEYTDVASGRYFLEISAGGFETARRVIEVWPGDTTVLNIGLENEKPVIETIVVSASRYEILSDVAGSRFVLDQRTIQNMPDVGEDPLRVVQRLPGAAASGASAKTHFRGGEQGEIDIMLNGKSLFDPFHIRDYQSIFSAIDARAIEGVEVFTGGFPAQFGDRMSGLVLMESLESIKPRHTEIGLSVYNTSFLTAGSTADRNWLLSARRGNLDLVIDPQFGEPSYYDVFAEFEYEFSPDAAVSINALYADDAVRVVLETDPEELEQVSSQTRNTQIWVTFDNRWSGKLTSKTVLSAVLFDNLRDGSLGDEEKIVAAVMDAREIEEYGLRQDWTYTSTDRHLMQWGIQATYADAAYRYANSAEYFGLPSMWVDQPETSSLAAEASPNGSSYAVYFSDRWQLSENMLLEWGLRWDDQTYTETDSESQLSPRLNLLRSLGDATQLRLSWGRYHQSQGIGDLQIEDGITRFWPAQRADHIIVGVRHLIDETYALRLEAFHKDMQRVRPRFENLHDPLGLIPEIQPDRVRLDPSSAKAQGVEVTLDRVNGPLTWWLSYTWSEVTDQIDGRNQLRSWDQTHALQGGLQWSRNDWDISLAAKLHTGWPTTDLALIDDGLDEDGEPQFIAVPGARNELRHGDFASIDFRISRKWKLTRSSLTAFLEVSNIAARHNECCLDFDFDEDESSGEDVFDRGVDHWPGLLPAVGILWEF